MLQKRQDGHIGWCEMFLTSILQINGLDFIEISPSEAEQRDLVFPNVMLVTMLPIDITPDELAPPLQRSQMSLLNVCDMNENYSKIVDKSRDVTGKSNVLLIHSCVLRLEILLISQNFLSSLNLPK